MRNDIEYLLIVSLTTWKFSFVKFLFPSFVHCLHWVVFSLLICKCSLYILDTSPLVDVKIVNIFLFSLSNGVF